MIITHPLLLGFKAQEEFVHDTQGTETQKRKISYGFGTFWLK